MRKGRLHNIFETKIFPGLSNYLAEDDKSIKDYVIKTDIDKINPKLYEKAPVADEQVKDESISSLESIVTNLANNPKVGGSTSCSGGCVGLCVSCSGTCTDIPPGHYMLVCLTLYFGHIDDFIA